MAYPTELFGARALEARALCMFRLSRYREAAYAYAQVERLQPDEPAHRLRRVLAEHRAGRQEPEELSVPASTPPNGFRWPARALLSGLAIDIGEVSVGVTATDAMRASAVRALLGRVAPSDQAPVVHLHFGGHRLAPPERDPDDCGGELRIWHDDQVLELAYGRHVGARVESGHGRLGGQAPNLRSMVHQVMPFMLASLLAPHDRFVLHGGAIQRDGRAVLVLGGSGMGKSTLILAALEDGWTVLADDLAVMRRGPAGPVVSGIPKPLVVPAEVLGVGRTSVTDSRGRVRVPFEAWDRGSHPVGAVVLVGHGDGSTAEVDSLERPDLLAVLLDSMLSRQPSNMRRFFRLAAQLWDVQGFRLRHSRVPELRTRKAAKALANRLADWD